MTTDARTWVQRTQLPVLTVGAFLVLALLFWVNAALNRYRFNVVLAVLASLPLLVVLIRGAVKSRPRRRRPSPVPHPKG